jgi:hypothetical protein
MDVGVLDLCVAHLVEDDLLVAHRPPPLLLGLVDGS